MTTERTKDAVAGLRPVADQETLDGRGSAVGRFSTSGRRVGEDEERATGRKLAAEPGTSSVGKIMSARDGSEHGRVPRDVLFREGRSVSSERTPDGTASLRVFVDGLAFQNRLQSELLNHKMSHQPPLVDFEDAHG